MVRVSNPVMAGFYPDPSVCRVGEHYYMVHSTFAYFPGVPIFRSENLADWEQIGNILNRDSQLPLTGCRQSEGIFAPTIRYDQGLFYMITTNVSAGTSGGNFIVTSKTPEGPWSEPYYLGEEAKGIDPSLFFDTDGSCYYIGQREKSGAEYDGDCEIWIQKLNLQTMKLEGEAVPVLDGFQKYAVWPEGPHLYRKGDYYYIIHAESGTAFHHSVMAARSRTLFGPYEYCPSNPIITHRHLGRGYPVTCVGHADLVDDGNENWYMVLLACRPQKGYTLLGRETFLAKVVWEDGWPVVNPSVGRLEENFEIPGSGNTVRVCEVFRNYTFDREDMPPEFLSLRNNRSRIMSLSEHEGYLRLYMRADTLKSLGEPAYLAVRQQHQYYTAETELDLCFGRGGGCAGIALMQDHENHVRAECFREESEEGFRIIQSVQGHETILSSIGDRITGKVYLKVSVYGLHAEAWFKSQDNWRLLSSNINMKSLSTELAGGFTGCTVGMFASGDGEDTGGYADFASFTYCGMPFHARRGNFFQNNRL